MAYGPARGFGADHPRGWIATLNLASAWAGRACPASGGGGSVDNAVGRGRRHGGGDLRGLFHAGGHDCRRRHPQRRPRQQRHRPRHRRPLRPLPRPQPPRPPRPQSRPRRRGARHRLGSASSAPASSAAAGRWHAHRAPVPGLHVRSIRGARAAPAATRSSWSCSGTFWRRLSTRRAAPRCGSPISITGHARTPRPRRSS